jgi:hypothetical protein
MVATVSLTVLLLLSSIVLSAAYRRPFWIEFAICGIGYLMLTVIPFMEELRDLLLTTQSNRFLLEKLHDYGTYSKMPNQFLIMCDCLWSLILASFGGLLGQFAAARSCTRS